MAQIPEMKKPIKPKCKAVGSGRGRWRRYFEDREKWVKVQAKLEGVPVSRWIADRLT
jgi:hypothetical protein